VAQNASNKHPVNTAAILQQAKARLAGRQPAAIEQRLEEYCVEREDVAAMPPSPVASVTCTKCCQKPNGELIK